MARKVVSAIFKAGGNGQQYIADRGAALDAGFTFIQPVDMQDGVVDTILNTIGAELKNAGNAVICPETTNFKPRKLVFIRANGNSMSIPIPLRSEIINFAIQLRGFISAIDVTNPVACIKLIGERFDNIIDELSAGQDKPAATPGVWSRGGVFAGTIVYSTDTVFGTSKNLAVKVDTEVLTNGKGSAAPTILGGTWANCVGDFVNGGACPGKERRDHRRYIGTLTVAIPDGATPGGDTSAAPGTQRTEIPVTDHTQPEILACGQALAVLPSMLCLGYRGESFDRIHKLLPAPTTP